MEELIKAELKRIEAEKEIRILYAVESGSRAWGFASKDSDWDVRFVYIHKPEWYLSIDDKKDSLELMLPNDLDFAGWELRKTLKLLRKSNPPLLEWLRSPLVYLEQFSTIESMRKLSDQYFNPRSCTYHYLHMAEGNYKEYLRSEQVRVKKYFYVLRPILACMWIESNQSMVPMEFEELLDSQIEKGDLKREILTLLKRKKSGDELDLEKRIDVINEFLETEITHFIEAVKGYDNNERPESDKLDKLFRSALSEVWG